MANIGPPPITGTTLLDRWLSSFWKFSSALPASNISGLASLPNAANDAAAATAGVQIGSMYRNGSALMVRVS